MQPIIKFGLTRSGISIILHTVVIYGPLSLGVIGMFDPIVSQGAVQISFLIKHCYKITPYIALLHANHLLSNLKRVKGLYIRKWLPQNSRMVTDRVLDTQVVEIYIDQPYSHLSPSNICTNILHLQFLSHDTPSAKGLIRHFRSPCHKLLPPYVTTIDLWGNMRRL